MPKYKKPWIILLPNKYLRKEDDMDGKTIKTLAEYITRLKEENAEYFKDYKHNQFDSNGVEVDHVETFWPPNERPGT